MSRYELAGKAPGTTVCIGWDQPLMTYFLQVYDPRRTGPRVWLGGRPGELYDLDAFKVAARPHVDLPAELLGKLYADRAARTVAPR